jgi:flagellar hook assembly protein FlgD
MDIAALTRGANTAGTNTAESQKAFRDADFMKMLLTEITQQDPFKPQDTSHIVEGMQKLQELANSRYTKFRDDQKFAQTLMSKEVTVNQVSLTANEREALKARGLDPDVGFGVVTGKVESYRVVDETVYVNVKGKDYPIDNVYQINPIQHDSSYLATLSSGVLGANATYYVDDPLNRQTGKVTAVSIGVDNEVMVTIGGQEVPFDHVNRISL